MKPKLRCVVTSKDNSQVGFIRRKQKATITVTGAFGEIEFPCPDSWFEIGDPAVIELVCKKRRKK